MDATAVVTEPVEDRFAGLTFGDACAMLFAECKSNAPSSEGFQSMIDYIGKIHQSMGLEFSCGEYWNESTISGSHEVFPPNLGQELNVIPDVLTPEYLLDLIEKVGGIEAANATYRAAHERVMRGSRASSSGIMDTRILVRSFNTAPIYLATSVAADDEDDFI